MDLTTQKAKEIFISFAGKIPEQEWEARLEQDCEGDEGLKQRVRALLRAHAEPESFWDSPPPGLTANIDQPPLDRPGTQIGPYKLLEQIGEGGMGVVFVAVQAPPVERKVALKIIKPGMDTSEVLARFEAERQALALMDHPNIAKVLDGGATAAGRPYFVMELVKGIPITEYCDREKLTTQQRLDLFISLCHGVQHAHQKGVIHRDLKPSNVLVEVHDVTPVPKIIDFGVAKAVGRHLTEQSLHTGLSQMVGTPLYMSPEQAGQSSLGVDTRSDIYSLGVLLYELLTGHTPFEEETLRTAGPDDLRRIIREVDPPRPSARVSTLQAAELSTISEHRRVEPRKLSQQLCGDLDWIVMKALEKDRTRRYETASALAADVQRHLVGQPVEACPPSAWYRFTKFARRNRTAFVTSALVALALIAGTGVAVWQAVRATRAERRAEDRLQFARQAVDEMYVQVAEKWLSQQDAMTPLQKQFLARALAVYQRLATEENDDPEVRFEATKAQMRVGQIQEKLEQYAEAEATFRQALELFQRLLRENPDEPHYRKQFALAQDSLGRLLSVTGQLPEAERQLRQALEIRQALAAQFPGEAEYRENLADCQEDLGQLLRDSGRSREAEATLRQSLVLRESLLTSSPKDPARRVKLALSRSQLAQIVRADKPVEAEALYRASISTVTALVAEDPKTSGYRASLAATNNDLGLLLRQRGRLLEAETSFRHALPFYEVLAAEFPRYPLYRWELSKVLGNLAAVLLRAGKADESNQFDLRRHKIIDTLAADCPDVPKYQDLIANDWTNQACELLEKGKLEEARNLLERAIAKNQTALKSSPDNPKYQTQLAKTLNILGDVLDPMGRLDEAITAYRSALEIEERVTAKTPLVVRETLWDTLVRLAQSLEKRGQLAEAEVLCRRSLEVGNRVVTDAPDMRWHRMRLAETLDYLDRLCHQAKKLSEAEQAGRRAVEIQNALAAERPDDAEVRREAGAYASNLAWVLMDGGQITEARGLMEQAVIHQRDALKLDPGNAVSKERLREHLGFLTLLQIRLGDKEAAARTAGEFARHVNSFDSENLILNCESMIAREEQMKRPDCSYPQRRKSAPAALALLVKAVIKDVIQRAANDPEQYMIADLLTTAPEPFRDPELALKLARRAVELKPGDGVCLQSLGGALYRAGDFRGSIEAIKKADGGKDSFIRAMAHWQLGEKTEAKAVFDAANKWLKEHERECEKQMKQGTITYPPPVQQKRLQAEAAALLKSAPASPARGSETKQNTKP